MESYITYLEAFHLRLDQLSRVRQRPLVLDVGICDPSLSDKQQTQ